MQDNYNILLNKLRRFHRKYYINRMLRGLIWFVAVFALFFLLANIFEYFSWSSPLTRTILFYTYLGINLGILILLVIIPLLKLFRIGRTLDDEEAAEIIGAHFPEVRDKLINTIQLKKLSEENGTIELLKASIDQKTQSLRPVPFVRAIEFKKNRKYLRYALPPVLLIVILLLAAPDTITEPSKRIINHRTSYERPLPFNISILNEKLETVQQEDFTLKISVEGDEFPAEIYLVVNGSSLAFQKTSGTGFEYTLNNLQQDLTFSINAEGYAFGPYFLRVLPKPIIIAYEALLDYPAYTGKKDEVFENTGDFIVPLGSEIKWKVLTRDAQSLVFRFPDELASLDEQGSNAFEYKKTLMESLNYSITVANDHLINPDTLAYAITVIPDLYPTALFEEFRDSVYEKRLFFRGQISDDYGVSSLTFNYEFLNNFDTIRTEGKVFKQPVSISDELTKQLVFHHFDLNTLDIRPGDELAYYFEVWDNDGINGRKSSRSHKMIFRAPSEEEISTQTNTENQEIKDEMEDIIKEAQQLQLQIEKMNKELVNKDALSWQDKEQIRSMLEQQKQIQERMEFLQEKNLQKMQREEEYKEVNENILQKQAELQELFEEVMTDEMKELFEELQKLLEEINKEEVSDLLEQMEMSAEDIEKELDRNLELFKQLEFDKRLTEAIEDLNDLAKQQEELAKNSEEKKADDEALAKEQEELIEEFEKLREEIEEIEELNKELEDPNKMADTEEKEESIKQDQEESLEQLQKGKNQKASPSQQKAAQKMQEMADQMFQMQMQMSQQKAMEDIRVLREILENLLVISFDQEELIADLHNTNVADPRYQDIIQRQHEIKDNMQIVEDSLYALSKRQAMIEPFVNKEVENINKSIEDANSHLEDRKKGQASSSQQYVMTSVNNLALLLAEALNKMQQQQNMDMPGNSSCDNPGGSSPSSSPQNMSQMQKQINEQMKKMKDGQKKKGEDGKKGEEGKKPGGGQQSGSEQFARMAAQQEAVRQQMQEYLEELKGQGETGDAGLNKMMEDMEKTELDLVNKRITEETMQRQEEIFTRLLKHENAVREREKEERRESKEAKNQEYSNPTDFLEYNSILLNEVELLKTVPPDLKPFYRRKVNEYFYNFGN